MEVIKHTEKLKNALSAIDNSIVVCSPSRNGSSFLVEALIKNFPTISFLHARPSFSTLENLILPHDENVSLSWIDWLHDCYLKNKAPLFKTHAIPDEILGYLSCSRGPMYAKPLIAKIWERAQWLYIYRHRYTSTESLFQMSKNGMVIGFNAARLRLSELNMNDYLCQQNMNKLPHRPWTSYDENIVTALAHHNYSWINWIDNNPERGTYLKYEELMESYESTFVKVGTQLKNKIGPLITSVNTSNSILHPVRPTKPIGAKYQSQRIGKFLSITNTVYRRLIRLIGQEQLLRQRVVYTPPAHRFKRVILSEAQKETIDELYTEAWEELISSGGRD